MSQTEDSIHCLNIATSAMWDALRVSTWLQLTI